VVSDAGGSFPGVANFHYCLIKNVKDACNVVILLMNSLKNVLIVIMSVVHNNGQLLIFFNTSLLPSSIFTPPASPALWNAKPIPLG